MDTRDTIPSWPFMGRWVSGTVIGLALGAIAAIILSFLLVNPFYPEETNLIVGLCMGGAMGFFQVLALRRWFPLGWGWIGGAALTLAPPFIAAVIFEELAIDFAAPPGQLWFWSVVGLGWLAGAGIQARTLRSHTARAWWWVGAVGGSWLMAFASASLIGEIGGALVLAAVSGGLLLWILAGAGRGATT